METDLVEVSVNVSILVFILACKVRLNDNPVLSIPYINQDGDVKFNCTFRSSTSRTDVVYKVSWTVDGHPLKNRNGIDEVTLLSSYERVAILDAYNLNGNLNKMVYYHIIISYKTRICVVKM